MLQKLLGLFKGKKTDGAPGSGEAAPAPESGNAAPSEPEKGFGKKSLLIAGGGGLLALLLVGGGAYYVLFSGDGAAGAKGRSEQAELVPPQVTYYDVPDIIVNIQTADGSPAYLKIGVALELSSPQEKADIQPLMPRIVDQFQGYLRELRVDDLRGSAGVMRLKEELLRRINVAAAPFHVRDVLLKEMIVQ